MKIIIAVVSFFASISGFTQTTFKYQMRVNLIPVGSLHYGGAVRAGVETINRKLNFGVDFIGYTVSENRQIKVLNDSPLLHRNNNHTIVAARGLTFNMMKGIKLRFYQSELKFGLQGFIGWLHKYEYKNTEVLDTLHVSCSYGSMRPNPYRWTLTNVNEVVERHGAKLALGIGFFVRYQLRIYRRFTLAPELIIPALFLNDQSSKTKVNFNPGFSFCLGYCFGKIK